MLNPKSRPMAWLQLFRIANLPSAVANILMGFLLVHQTWSPTVELILLIVASSCMYLAGMVLNDVFDFEVDLEQRPNRPLPSQRISKPAATTVGFAMLIGGVVIACLAGVSATGGFDLDPTGPMVRTGLIAVGLAVCVVLYDGPMKRTIAAPFIMGLCRTLNILLGASTFAPAVLKADEGFLFGLPTFVWWAAISIGVLISGATLLGRKEAVENQNRTPLFIAVGIIVASLVGIATIIYCPDNPTGSFQVSPQQKKIFPLVIGLLSLSILRRVVEAAFTAKPQKIQMGVVAVLRSLIILDAMFCFLATPSQPLYSLVVLALLVPSFLMGRYFRST